MAQLHACHAVHSPTNQACRCLPSCLLAQLCRWRHIANPKPQPTCTALPSAPDSTESQAAVCAGASGLAHAAAASRWVLQGHKDAGVQLARKQNEASSRPGSQQRARFKSIHSGQQALQRSRRDSTSVNEAVGQPPNSRAARTSNRDPQGRSMQLVLRLQPCSSTCVGRRRWAAPAPASRGGAGRALPGAPAAAAATARRTAACRTQTPLRGAGGGKGTQSEGAVGLAQVPLQQAAEWSASACAGCAQTHHN